MLLVLNLNEVEYLKRILDTRIKYVPLSMGFSDLFQPKTEIGKKLFYQFSRMSERAEIGVRNEYTADILKKHGITNTCVVGCPSLFYHMDREYQMMPATDTKIENVNFNSHLFSVLLQRLNLQKPKLVKYILAYYYEHHDNTFFTLQQLPGKGISLNNGRIDEEIKNFLIKTGRYYFNTDDWIKGLSNIDFSFGTCLHGNIASVLSKKPALFIANDERMKGICDYHSLPYIDIKSFDDTRSLEYYYELADYTEFNKNFTKNYDNFIDFCRRNEINLKIDLQ